MNTIIIRIIGEINRLNFGKVRTKENALWSFAPQDVAVILRLFGEVPVQLLERDARTGVVACLRR